MEDGSGIRDQQQPEEVPQSGALLGIDFGTKKVGLAISTPDQTIASPLEIMQRSVPQAESRYFCKICKEFRIKGLVIGLPVHMSGDEGTKAGQSRQYGLWMAETLELPVTFWDERFTTSMAEHYLRESGLSKARQKKRLDMLAAQIMLQSFLDAADRSRPPSAIGG